MMLGCRLVLCQLRFADRVLQVYSKNFNERLGANHS